MPKMPWMKWYSKDWLSDERLRLGSLAARGLWADLLSLMHQCGRRGFLEQANGNPLTTVQISRAIGCTPEEVTQVLRELSDLGVFSCTDSGVIYSRKMVRDERKRELCAQAGQKGGGNPTFRGHPKGVPKGDCKPISNLASDICLLNSSGEEELGAGGNGFAFEVLGQMRENDPRWYSLWAENHARRFGFNRDDDPATVADWWRILRPIEPTCDELEEASLWLLANETHRPKGRPEHPSKLKARILSTRRSQSARAPAAEKAKAEESPRMTQDEYKQHRAEMKKKGLVS